VTSTTTPSVSDRLTSPSWWLRASDGQLTLWQPPNPALIVWLVALALGLLDLSAEQANTVDGVRHGALLVWALDELARGASPFRRVLGAVVLVGVVSSLVAR